MLAPQRHRARRAVNVCTARSLLPASGRHTDRKADAVAQRHTETRGTRPPAPKSTVATAARTSWPPVRRTHPAVRPTRFDENPAASRVGTYYRLQYPLPARAPTPKPSIAAALSAHTALSISTSTDHTQTNETRTRARSSLHIHAAALGASPSSSPAVGIAPTINTPRVRRRSCSPRTRTRAPAHPPLAPQTHHADYR
ncbi:hypothetical protein B0H16DRAFT_1546677, partial [Mycena metata]